MTRIHPTAIVDPTAEVDETAEIGPFCIVGKDVRIGAGTRLLSHITICDHVRIGENNVIHMGAVIGHEPQYVGFDSSIVSYTVLGHENHIREYVTIHRSITAEGETRLGDKNFLMAMSHVAHDCRVGDQVIMANASVLGGHVSVGDRAFISAYVGAHQFVRIGTLAMIGGHSRITKDVPPYTLNEGDSYVVGLNVVGLRRAAIPSETRNALSRAYKVLFRSGLSIPNGLQALRLEWEGRALPPELDHFLQFCSEKSRRGLARAPRRGSTESHEADD
jgi:UDP-N-acetylglucosamine acyltransferase